MGEGRTMKNTAPSAAEMPVVSLQPAKSMPTVLSAPGVRAGPSVPMVTKESNSASAMIGKNAGLVCAVQRRARSQRGRAGEDRRGEAKAAEARQRGAVLLLAAAHRTDVRPERSSQLEPGRDDQRVARLTEQGCDAHVEGLGEPFSALGSRVRQG